LLSGLTAFFPFNWNNPQQLFTDKKTADRVVSELLKKQIQIRSIGFQNAGSEKQSSEPVHALRVSTGYFNNAGQVGAFRDALQEVLKRLS
jgi:selenocysteine lyase/cysteine desulfurase